MGLGDHIGKNDGLILTVANGDLASADTSYTYFNMAKEDYRHFSLTFTITATTLTIEGSNDSADTVDASATWTDVTTDLTGSSNATSSGIWIVDSPVPIKRLRIKRVTTNSTNALKLFLTRSR